MATRTTEPVPEPGSSAIHPKRRLFWRYIRVTLLFFALFTVTGAMIGALETVLRRGGPSVIEGTIIGAALGAFVVSVALAWHFLGRSTSPGKAKSVATDPVKASSAEQKPALNGPSAGPLLWLTGSRHAVDLIDTGTGWGRAGARVGVLTGALFGIAGTLLFDDKKEFGKGAKAVACCATYGAVLGAIVGRVVARWEREQLQEAGPWRLARRGLLGAFAGGTTTLLLSAITFTAVWAYAGRLGGLGIDAEMALMVVAILAACGVVVGGITGLAIQRRRNDS